MFRAESFVRWISTGANLPAPPALRQSKVLEAVGGSTHVALACPPSRQPMIRELGSVSSLSCGGGWVAHTLIA